MTLGTQHSLLARSETRSSDFLDDATRAFLTVFVFAVPWENALVIPGLGTVGRLAGACAFLLGILAVVAHRRIRPLQIAHVLMAVFVLWSAVTLAWSLSLELSTTRLLTYLQLLIMVWEIWQFADRREYQIRLLKAYVLGSYISIFSTIWNYKAGTASAYMRYSSSGFDPNDAALILALSLVMSIYISIQSKGSVWVWLCRTHVILVIAVIFLTASRGQLFAVAIALTLAQAAYSRMPGSQRPIALLVVIAGIFSVPFVIPKSSLERLATIGTEIQHGTLNERRQIWVAGLGVASEHPMMGIGTGAFPRAVEPVLGAYVVAHNTFISIFVETGLVGLGVFLTIIISLAAAAFRLRGLERRFLLTLLLTWCVGVFSLTWDWRKATWLVFGLIAAFGGSRFIPGTRKGSGQEY